MPPETSVALLLRVTAGYWLLKSRP